MNAVDIIVRKRDKAELTAEEIQFFVKAFTVGDIPDYQAAALAMAITLNGMTPAETTCLALAMAHSGKVLDLSDVVDLAVDKHSSGGVGDKTSLVVLPIVTACGLPVGKMSGRGLGFSGGTLDKMESIPGYRCDLTTEEFKAQLKEHGIVLAGQSVDLAPADGKLYALRDVTGTVPSMPLIASSIMCKKIAGGASAIVLDVKVGLGAFMRTLEEARALASLMVEIGRLAGRQTVALIADMNQPLGTAVGNSLELVEAIEALHGRGPSDLHEHCLHVASHMLVLGKQAGSLAEARTLAEAVLASGAAFGKFRELVVAQGGDASYVDKPELLPRAALVEVVPAPGSGYVEEIHAGHVGEVAVALGAGRAKKGDRIDHAVGILVHARVGDSVRQGEPLFTVHANERPRLESARAALLQAVTFSQSPVSPLPLFYD